MDMTRILLRTLPRSARRKPEEGVARIEEIVTDMGNGSMQCSNCKTVVTDYVQQYNEQRSAALNQGMEHLKALPGMACPSCKRQLYESSGTYCNSGGSDF